MRCLLCETHLQFGRWRRTSRVRHLSTAKRGRVSTDPWGIGWDFPVRLTILIFLVARSAIWLARGFVREWETKEGEPDVHPDQEGQFFHCLLWDDPLFPQHRTQRGPSRIALCVGLEEATVLVQCSINHACDPPRSHSSPSPFPLFISPFLSTNYKG